MRYDKNIEQVLSVIDKFPRSCRKNFLNNLKTLEYEYLSLDELYKLVGDSTVNALYVPFHNKVYFNDYNNTDVEINHEFFHISSRNAYSLGVVGIYMIGNNKILVGKYLNEGITDYLAHLSVNLKDTIILGPTTASMFKVNNIYRFQIILKYKNYENIKQSLINLDELYKTNNKVNIEIDNNPSHI